MASTMRLHRIDGVSTTPSSTKTYPKVSIILNYVISSKGIVIPESLMVDFNNRILKKTQNRLHH